MRRWVRRILELPLAPLQSFVNCAHSEAYRAVVAISPVTIDQEKVQKMHEYLARVSIDMDDSHFRPLSLEPLAHSKKKNNNRC